MISNVVRVMIASENNATHLGSRFFKSPSVGGSTTGVRLCKIHLRTRILITSAPAIRAYIPNSFWRFFTSYKVNVRFTDNPCVDVSPHNTVSSTAGFLLSVR